VENLQRGMRMAPTAATKDDMERILEVLPLPLQRGAATSRARWWRSTPPVAIGALLLLACSTTLSSTCPRAVPRSSSGWILSPRRHSSGLCCPAVLGAFNCKRSCGRFLGELNCKRITRGRYRCQLHCLPGCFTTKPNLFAFSCPMYVMPKLPHWRGSEDNSHKLLHLHLSSLLKPLQHRPAHFAHISSPMSPASEYRINEGLLCGCRG
jgi:hypothetical protein